MTSTHAVLQNLKNERNEVEEKSIQIRALFESAALKAMTYQEYTESKDTGMSARILSKEDRLYLISTDPKVWQLLFESGRVEFKKSLQFELSETVKGIELSPDIIFRYTTSHAMSHIGGVKAAIKQSKWREASVLVYEQDLPMIVIRGCLATKNFTFTLPSFHCDAQAMISQQLINYFQTQKNKPTKALIPLEFPAEEGRGAVFSIGNVPFHVYNSHRYNDDLCHFMGLFDIPGEAMTWPLKKPLPSYVYCKKLLDDSAYASYQSIPAIKDTQAIFSYDTVLVLRLDHYIEQSLKFQKSLALHARIKRKDSTVATNAEIDKALAALKPTPTFSANTVKFSLFAAAVAWVCYRTFFSKSSSVNHPAAPRTLS